MIGNIKKIENRVDHHLKKIGRIITTTKIDKMIQKIVMNLNH